jgi:hypothetical protein
LEDLISTGLGTPFDLRTWVAGFAIDTVNQKMYMGDLNGIRVANIDGSNLHYILFVGGLYALYSKDMEAVPEIGSLIYTDGVNNPGIHRMDLGTGADHRRLVNTDRDNAAWVALDVTNNRFFYSANDNPVFGPPQIPIIGRADLDGSNAQTLVSGIRAYDIEFDVNQDKLYWATGDKIQRAHSDGSGVEDVLNIDFPGELFDVALELYLPNQASGLLDGSFDGSHTYADNGTYMIEVTVTDPEGAATTRSFEVQVSNVAPTAELSGAASVAEGSAYQVTIGPVTDPGADTVGEWRIDWGDSSPLEVYAGPPDVLSHVYADGPASRTISLTLQDEDGTHSNVATQAVQVQNVAPVVDAGPDLAAIIGEAVVATGSFTDPGADVWTGMVDYGTGGGFVPLALNPDKTFELSLQYATPGVRTVQVQVRDDDGGIGTDTIQVTVAPSFLVTSLAPNDTGFTVQLSRPANTSRINLYDGPDAAAEPADVTLIGDVVGPVAGSLVWDAANNRATFIKTGAPLIPDRYAVTLFSRADGWTDTAGRLLDGNGDGAGGDHYMTSFVVSPRSERLLAIPDIARGPSQAANVPNTGTGIPLTLSDGAGVLAVDVDVIYDPELLSISGVTRGAGAPANWSVTTNLVEPGRARITSFGVSPLPAGAVQALRLIADVPATAPIGAAHILRLENVRINGGLIAARGDDALAKVAFLADVDASRAYTAFDAAFVSRVVVGLDTGFDAYPLTDPVIIGNSSGTGSLSGLDAAYVAQKAVFLPRPEIPDLPAMLPAPSPDAIDPVIGAPLAIVAQAGQAARVPITIDNLADILGATVSVNYGTMLLDLDNERVELGSELVELEWTLVQNVDDETGVAHLVAYGVRPGAPGPATLFGLNYQVPPAATGTTPLDLSGPANDGGFMFTYVDGSLTVGLTGDLNGDGRVGLRDLVTLRQHFGTTAGAQPADGDLDSDGDVDRADLMRLVENLGRTSASQPLAAVVGQISNPSYTGSTLRSGRRLTTTARRVVAVDAIVQDTNWTAETLSARRRRAAG